MKTIQFYSLLQLILKIYGTHLINFSSSLRRNIKILSSIWSASPVNRGGRKLFFISVRKIWNSQKFKGANGINYHPVLLKLVYRNYPSFLLTSDLKKD